MDCKTKLNALLWACKSTGLSDKERSLTLNDVSTECFSPQGKCRLHKAGKRKCLRRSHPLVGAYAQYRFMRHEMGSTAADSRGQSVCTSFHRYCSFPQTSSKAPAGPLQQEHGCPVPPTDRDSLVGTKHEQTGW